jgi:pyochelin synthetase
VLYNQEEQEIVMFVVPSEPELTDKRVNREMLKLVPRYMLPGKTIFMDEFPLNPNGKIDRPLLKTMM